MKTKLSFSYLYKRLVIEKVTFKIPGCPRRTLNKQQARVCSPFPQWPLAML